MAEFILKKYETFEITGRGTVFSVHRDENDVEGIKKGDSVKPMDSFTTYEVVGIECFKNNFGKIGKNIGIIVKKLPNNE